MIKRVFILVISCLLYQVGQAQYYHDFGVALGGTNYVGEVGGMAEQREFLYDMKPRMTKIDGGLFYRYRYRENLGLNVGLNYLRIGGADSLTKENDPRRDRNLIFKNQIIELSGRAEYYFFSMNDLGGRGRYQMDLKAFFFGGVAGFFHDPIGYVEGYGWERLHPLSTEGVKYSRIQISIPTGVGMFITYKRNHRFGWEFNVRKTFTDYLDDAKGFYISHPEGSLASIYANPYNEDNATINKENYFEGSPRGNHVDDDWYLSSVFTYSYVMRGKSNFVRKKLKYTYGSSKRKKRTKAKF